MLKGKILLLNAPPNAGKDVIGERLQELTGAHKTMFKKSLYKATADLFGVDEGWLVGMATDRVYKEQLSTSLQVTFDCVTQAYIQRWQYHNSRNSDMCCISPRDALIYTSERVYKPTFGDEIFGLRAVENVDLERGTIFTDSGFDEELAPLVRAFGGDNIYVVQFSRDGCSFDGDSRYYLRNLKRVNSIFLENNGTVDEFCIKVLEWINGGIV